MATNVVSATAMSTLPSVTAASTIAAIFGVLSVKTMLIVPEARRPRLSEHVTATVTISSREMPASAMISRIAASLIASRFSSEQSEFEYTENATSVNFGVVVVTVLLVVLLDVDVVVDVVVDVQESQRSGHSRRISGPTIGCTHMSMSAAAYTSHEGGSSSRPQFGDVVVLVEVEVVVDDVVDVLVVVDVDVLVEVDVVVLVDVDVVVLVEVVVEVVVVVQESHVTGHSFRTWIPMLPGYATGSQYICKFLQSAKSPTPPHPMVVVVLVVMVVVVLVVVVAVVVVVCVVVVRVVEVVSTQTPHVCGHLNCHTNASIAGARPFAHSFSNVMVKHTRGSDTPLHFRVCS
jgi:hypothetical protein